MLHPAQKELRKTANKTVAKAVSRFFKTGPGQYGEGDQFLGIAVPNTRLITKKYITLSHEEIRTILSSPYHEERLFALLILVAQYSKNKQSPQVSRDIIEFYLEHRRYVNNWDLVDVTAAKLLGHYCFHYGKEKILIELSKSDRHWDRRIAIVATHYFILH
jgi:3-methyladenine DNA glycosylase AlkD